MRIKHKYILHLLMICVITYTGLCNASPSAFSNYGNIQNVQSYSSNPYWNPNSPYNQRMPTPVYVDGPDAKSGDCNQIAAQLIAQQCGMRNNCRDTKLKDIRPALMMQLTQMPGANYATSCAGYLDGGIADVGYLLQCFGEVGQIGAEVTQVLIKMPVSHSQTQQ